MLSTGRSPVYITNLIIDEDARPMAGKYLSKWRPGFIEQQKAIEDGEETKEAINGSENGIASAS